MTALVAAARELIHFLEASGFKACLIDGLVVQRWGEPRLTRDVDATVLADYGTEDRVIDAVLGRFAARRDDARDFALANRVLLVRATNGVDMDVSLAAFEFEREAIDRATSYEFEPGVALVTCSAEDLVRLQGGRGPAQGPRGHQVRRHSPGQTPGYRPYSPVGPRFLGTQGGPRPAASL